MSGQIAGPSAFSLELVAVIIGVSMIVGALDLLRQPGWAWKRADESKAAYLILVILVPIVGLALYAFKARPTVTAIASAGRAASLPFERFGQKEAKRQRHDGRPIGEIAPPVGFGSFGEIAGSHPLSTGGPEDFEPAPVEVSSTFFSSGTNPTRSARQPVGLARGYRPKMRTSLQTADGETPTVPAGWKADPTGRHQFRYWDGFHWTEHVANAGEQSKDLVSS
jgi:Protein of unknown function (DUF2510)